VEHSRDAMVLRPFTAFSINGSPTRLARPVSGQKRTTNAQDEFFRF
jgi:hypothetical protein